MVSGLISPTPPSRVGINLGESVKQTITLTHVDGSESTMDLQVSDDNPIEEIELSQMWDDSNILEVDFSRD